MYNLEQLEDDNKINFDIGYRGGNYKMPASLALELINANEKHLDNLPDFIGCGCNYLGGGLRGATSGSSNFTDHGIPKTIAKKLDTLVAQMIERYQEIEGSMNDEIYPDGETNWDAVGSNLSRKAGITSAY